MALGRTDHCGWLCLVPIAIVNIADEPADELVGHERHHLWDPEPTDDLFNGPHGRAGIVDRPATERTEPNLTMPIACNHRAVVEVSDMWHIGRSSVVRGPRPTVIEPTVSRKSG